jgi:diguanylate cyclase (GGDEF)-like protein/PAS domain S-box-containing protein
LNPPIKTIGATLPVVLNYLPGFLYQLQMHPNGDFQFLYLSSGVERLLGVTVHEALLDANNVLELIHPDDIDRVVAESIETAKAGRPWFGEFRIRSRNGREMFFESNDSATIATDGTITWTGYSNDVTEKRSLQQTIYTMSRQDILTGLANRHSFFEILQNAIQLAIRKQEQLALMFIDLDHFKPVNDNFGHGMGDTLLSQVAKRLTEALRASDSICRYGGDEFLVLLPCVPDLQSVLNVASKIIAGIEKPFVLGEHRINISCSIGVALFPDHAEDADHLVTCADKAMYQAKNSGGGQCMVFQPEA